MDMWTCASMNPGRSVASPRSITRAPAGTSRLCPTRVMRSPSTITMPGASGRSEVEVKTRAALSTTGAGAGPSARAAAPASAIPASVILASVSNPATYGGFLIRLSPFRGNGFFRGGKSSSTRPAPPAARASRSWLSRTTSRTGWICERQCRVSAQAKVPVSASLLVGNPPPQKAK